MPEQESELLYLMGRIRGLEYIVSTGFKAYGSLPNSPNDLLIRMIESIDLDAALAEAKNSRKFKEGVVSQLTEFVNSLKRDIT